jgi:hypothetical protein
MSNALTLPVNTAALPAHLQSFAAQLMALNVVGAGGISEGGHPRISIRGSKWAFVNASGDEMPHDQLELQVLLVGANPHVSKTYYASAYTPGSDAAPTCFSDNGVAPSHRANSPQASSCATCPHNVWGSQISENGKQVKACGDSKKLAVIRADNLTDPTYELRVPAASMKNLQTFLKQLSDRGVPAAAMVIGLGFERVAFPQITFTPKAWASAEQLAEIQKRMANKSEVDAATGADDRPREAPAQLGAAPAHVQEAFHQTAATAMAAPVQTVALRTRAPRKSEPAPAAAPAVFDPFATTAPAQASAAANVVIDPTPTSGGLDAELVELFAGMK